MLDRRALLKLNDLLGAHKIPLLVVMSYGLVGYMRLVTPIHTGRQTA